MASGSRLIVVANRLPIHRLRRGGEYVWETSPGGLVSALTPLLSEFEGYWVGWAGISGKVDTPRKQVGIALENVELSSSDIEDFYRGFSNSTLWPLYHDAVRQPEFHRRWWWPYVDVNRRFAETVAKVTRPGDLVWVHDYQLQLVPGFLRKLCPHTKIGFFLHIPFPPTELFAQLPWRRQLLEGLLGSDLIGFQTRFGGQNFSRCARRFTDVHGTHNQLHWNGRRVRVEPFPISIDFHKYVNIASMPDLQSKARKIKTQFGTRSIILGVDRLDYTKGIDIRLKAFETLLRRREDLVDKVVFVQIAVPSREHVGGYSSLRTSIEQLVGHINGTWGEPGRVPVHYLYRSLSTLQLAAYYLIADVMCVSPLRDGMNLVAKEYVAMRNDRTGALVLSEFAGASAELKGALLVNPHDIDGMANALEQALEMSDSDMRKRMSSMRRTLRKSDVFFWANSYMQRLST